MEEILSFIERARARIYAMAIVVCGSSIFLYPFSNDIIVFLMSFSPKLNFVFLSPVEPFLTRLLVSAFLGALMSVPIFTRSFWLSILFYAGGAFWSFVVFPVGMEFLIRFSIPNVVPMISIGKYVSFFILAFFVFGILFELPVLSFALAKKGIVSSFVLSRGRKHAILIIFILSAVLTPPDVLTQMLLALPLCGIYELSIILARIAEKR